MLTEKTFNAKGVPIHYALGAAAGPPLLLLHGITERWQTFLPLISLLINQWQLYALDLRGHGKSGRLKDSYRIVDYAQDITYFLEAQIHEPAVIAGHSLGGLLAIYVAARRPKWVKACIVVEPPLHLQHTPLKNLPNGPYETFKQIVEIITAHQTPEAIERHLVKYLSRDDAETRHVRAEVLSQLDPEALVLWLENQALFGLNLDALLRQIECPTLLIQGNPQRGAALFDEDAERALTLLRRGSRVSIPEGGHMLHHSHPEAVANALNGFCDQRM